MTITREELQVFVPFNSLSDEYLDKALAKVSQREVLKGTEIFKAGNRLEQSLFLLKGKVELTGTNYSSQMIGAASEARIHTLNPEAQAVATAVAKSRVKLLSIEREFLDLLLTWSESGEFSITGLQDQHIDVNDSEEEGDWMSSLLQSPLLMQVPPANIQQLFAHFETVEVSAGDQVVREGASGDYFYVIESGSAQVVSKGSNSCVDLHPGHYFGEEALVGETLRNATVTMLTAGSLMRLEKSVFTELLQEPIIRYVAFDDISQAEANQMLDVRLPIEHTHSAVPGSVNIPLGRLRKQMQTLPEGVRLVITDDGGHRSQVAAHLLCQAGFDSYILQDANLHYA